MVVATYDARLAPPASQAPARIIHVVKSVAQATLFAFLLASAVFFAALAIGPHTGRYRTLTVLTGSMRPSAPPGSVVVVTPIPLSQVRPGMVLTYQIPVLDHRVVTHRVVTVKDQGTTHPTITTKGDANGAPDPWEATLGGGPAWQERFALPHVGALVQALRSPAVHAVAVWGVPSLLAALWLVRIWGGGEGGRES